MALDTELNDDINQEVEELFDVGARQFLAGSALFNKKHQLLEGEFRARGMDARDGAWVAAISLS